jgi:hypothetical protein
MEDSLHQRRNQAASFLRLSIKESKELLPSLTDKKKLTIREKREATFSISSEIGSSCSRFPKICS